MVVIERKGGTRDLNVFLMEGRGGGPAMGREGVKELADETNYPSRFARAVEGAVGKYHLDTRTVNALIHPADMRGERVMSVVTALMEAYPRSFPKLGGAEVPAFVEGLGVLRDELAPRMEFDETTRKAGATAAEIRLVAGTLARRHNIKFEGIVEATPKPAETRNEAERPMPKRPEKPMGVESTTWEPVVSAVIQVFPPGLIDYAWGLLKARERAMDEGGVKTVLAYHISRGRVFERDLRFFAKLAPLEDVEVLREVERDNPEHGRWRCGEFISQLDPHTGAKTIQDLTYIKNGAETAADILRVVGTISPGKRNSIFEKAATRLGEKGVEQTARILEAMPPAERNELIESLTGLMKAEFKVRFQR